MKNIIFFLLFLLSSCAYAQRQDFKEIDGVQYFITRDTAAAGAIVVTYTPTKAAFLDAQSKLGSVLGQIEQINLQITELQNQRRVLNGERKELEDILATLQAPRSAAPPPTDTTTPDNSTRQATPAAPKTKPPKAAKKQ
jgi:TolA-binding protein